MTANSHADEATPAVLQRAAPSGSLLAKLVEMVEEMRQRQAEDADRLAAIAHLIETARHTAAPVDGAPSPVSADLAADVSAAAADAVREAMRCGLPAAVDDAVRAVLGEAQAGPDPAEMDPSERASRRYDEPAARDAPVQDPDAGPPLMDLDAFGAALSEKLSAIVDHSVGAAVDAAVAPRFDAMVGRLEAVSPPPAELAASASGVDFEAADTILRELDNQASRSAGLIAAAESQSRRIDVMMTGLRGLAGELRETLADSVADSAAHLFDARIVARLEDLAAVTEAQAADARARRGEDDAQPAAPAARFADAPVIGLGAPGVDAVGPLLDPRLAGELGALVEARASAAIARAVAEADSVAAEAATDAERPGPAPSAAAFDPIELSAALDAAFARAAADRPEAPAADLAPILEALPETVSTAVCAAVDAAWARSPSEPRDEPASFDPRALAEEVVEASAGALDAALARALIARRPTADLDPANLSETLADALSERLSERIAAELIPAATEGLVDAARADAAALSASAAAMTAAADRHASALDDALARLDGQTRRSAGLIAANDTLRTRMDAIATVLKSLAAERGADAARAEPQPAPLSEARAEELADMLSARLRADLAAALADLRPTGAASDDEGPSPADLARAVATVADRLDAQTSRAAGLVAAADRHTDRLDALLIAVRGLAEPARRDQTEASDAAVVGVDAEGLIAAVADAVREVLAADAPDAPAEAAELNVVAGAIDDAVARLDGQTARAAGLLALAEGQTKRIDSLVLGLRGLAGELREISGPAADAAPEAGDAAEPPALIAEPAVAPFGATAARSFAAEAARAVVALQGVATRADAELSRLAETVDALAAPRAETAVAPTAEHAQALAHAVAEALADLRRMQFEILDRVDLAPASADAEPDARSALERLQWRVAEFAAKLRRVEADLSAAATATADADAAAEHVARHRAAADDIARAAESVLDLAAAVMGALPERSLLSEDPRAEDAA